MPKQSVGMEQTYMCDCVWETDVSASRAVPQICDVTQVFRQVVFVLCLGGQLKVSAEWVQPHRIGSTHKHMYMWESKIYLPCNLCACVYSVF